MKRNALFTLSTAVALIVAISVGNAQDEKQKSKSKKGKRKPVTSVKCPVAGKEIKIAAAKTVEYKKAKVYVCCDGCVGKMKKDATKFAAKANHQLLVTRQARQTKCPMSGGKIDKKQFVKASGVRVAFCCDQCKGKAEAVKGDKQIAALFSDAAFKKAFAVKKPKKDGKSKTKTKKSDA